MLSKLAIAVSLAVLAIAAPTTEHVHKRQNLANVIENCKNPGDVALTFDDGPYNFEKNIVDVLDRNGAKGTFFYSEFNWSTANPSTPYKNTRSFKLPKTVTTFSSTTTDACIYDANMMDNVKYAYSHGHQISSHTWAHKDLTTLSADQIQDEMQRTEEAIQRITGAAPAFFRPPYGNYNDDVRRIAGQRGLSLVMWSFDSEDSVGASVDQQKANFDNAAKKFNDPLLSLEHSPYSDYILAFPDLPPLLTKLNTFSILRSMAILNRYNCVSVINEVLPKSTDKSTTSLLCHGDPLTSLLVKSMIVHEITRTSGVLEYAIGALKKAGYKNFVTVADCVGSQPYRSVGAPGTPDLALLRRLLRHTEVDILLRELYLLLITLLVLSIPLRMSFRIERRMDLYIPFRKPSMILNGQFSIKASRRSTS
ncbi:hypothetical protein NP233_g477 [Leucocoprinus birnbaumii]|uniref:NodB homology domain-containing protein n=1 Tax=Leucocoprinus birnbaumii TaxID=56174 RepID=A0AAD5W402_9AGAR|nr:hypothetical protein NP233_g477 [Leucocoprinus birnbaumii]